MLKISQDLFTALSSKAIKLQSEHSLQSSQIVKVMLIGHMV